MKVSTFRTAAGCVLIACFAGGCSSSGGGAGSSASPAGGGSASGGGAAVTSAAPTVGSTAAPSDAATVQAVQKQIAADPSMKGASVKASVQAGSISLDGTVKTPAQKDRAEQIVDQVQKSQSRQEGVMDNLLVGE